MPLVFVHWLSLVPWSVLVSFCFFGSVCSMVAALLVGWGVFGRFYLRWSFFPLVVFLPVFGRVFVELFGLFLVGFVGVGLLPASC